MSNKKQQIIKNIRRDLPFESSPRQPCFICGKYQSITHQHHVVYVSELAQLAIDYDYPWYLLPIRGVWLCPNHHAIVHAINNITTERGLELSNDIEDSEWCKFDELDKLRKMQFDIIFKCIELYDSDNYVESSRIIFKELKEWYGHDDNTKD